MKKKVHRFDIYRYQLLPIDRFYQGQLFGEIRTIADLLEKKNEIFQKMLLEKMKLEENGNIIIAKAIEVDRDFILFRYAVNRSITRETDRFTEEELENWPSFLVVVWNAQDKQYLLIEERREAFQHTEIVVSAIEKAICTNLEKKQLRMHAEPLFEVEEFWKLIEKYSGKILAINFELVTPNMAIISKTLNDDLKALAKITNTSTTNITLTSDPKSTLAISPKDELIQGLVEYSSEGGGNISLKAKGIKRMLQTTKTKKTLELDELTVSGRTPLEIIETIKGFLA